jgi:hypothetical protein
MATVIASAGTISNPTDISLQSKLIYDGTRYWAFYMKSGTANTLFYAYSSNLSSWTESSVALASGTGQDGRNLTVLWDSSNSLVLVGHYNSTNTFRYIRGVISGTSITWGGTDRYSISTATGVYNWALIADSSNYAVALYEWYSNAGCSWSTNTLSSSFADTAASWGQTDPGALTGNWISAKLIALASRSLLALIMETGRTSILSNKWGGSSWGGYVDSVSCSTYQSAWDVCRISDSSIYVVTQSGASSLSMSYTTNQGTSYASRTAPGWPSSGLATNSQLALVTDGTDLYLVCIRGDSSCSVSVNKYTVSGDSWGGWTDIETGGTQTRTYINGYWLNSGLKVLYTQTNGSNYDVTVSSYTGVSIEQEGYRFRNDDGSESGATWDGSQDTNKTGAAGTSRLRFILNATGDPAAITPQFEYRRKPSGGSWGSWNKIGT